MSDVGLRDGVRSSGPRATAGMAGKGRGDMNDGQASSQVYPTIDRTKLWLVTAAGRDSERDVAAVTRARLFGLEEAEVVDDLAAGVRRLDDLVDPAALGRDPDRRR